MGGRWIGEQVRKAEPIADELYRARRIIARPAMYPRCVVTEACDTLDYHGTDDDRLLAAEMRALYEDLDEVDRIDARLSRAQARDDEASGAVSGIVLIACTLSLIALMATIALTPAWLHALLYGGL